MAVDRVQRRMAAIVAVDVVGYSRLMGADETGTLAELKAHRTELVDAKVADHQGRIFKLTGDGMLVEFPSVVNAVACAVEIQRGMRERNANLPESRRIEFRMGVNVGDVIIEDGDIFGEGVNLAARLESIAQPGGITLSTTVRDHIGNRIDVALQDLGERNLKNIERPVRVYQVIWEGQQSASIEERFSPLPDRPSIAVLPFTNMSGDAEQDYFADGLTEDLITSLSKFRWFFVIARNSSFTYKGRSTTVQQVGRDLGVRYVLEGSTRKSGERVRVTAQLVETETGHHVWADRYDRALSDLFDVQDEIIERVTGAIEPEMLRTETVRARRKTPESLTAWDLIFRGMWHFYQVSRDHHRRAQELFRKAAETEPDVAEGHTWLGRCCAGLLFYGWSNNPEADAAEGWEAALRGARLAEADPYAHYAVGIMAVVTSRPKEAIDAAQRALDLSPSFALGYLELGVARLFLGGAAQAIEPLEHGLRLSPHDPQAFIWLQFLAIAHFLAGEHDKAVRRARDAAAKRPESFSAHCALACALAALGHEEEARQAAAQMERILAGGSGLANLLARFVEPTDRERILHGLRESGWEENEVPQTA